jgi:hypothetical protein
MKFLSVRVARAAAVAACLAGMLAAAQTTSPPFPAPTQNQEPPKQTPQKQTTPKETAPNEAKGQVIFSRSTDENGDATTQAGPAPAHAGQAPGAATAQDVERQAVTYTSFDMDVHLRSAEHQIAVRAQMTVRNDGKTPLAHLPMQISSSLNWERIRIAGHDALYQVALVNSDADHTGQLREANVSLGAPLAPGASVEVDATYSGPIESNARRLLSIGTPADMALHSDWDQIDTAFTGLRGFGNVVWYPVSSVPVLLGDGAKLFDEMGEHKLRMAPARFRMRLTVEFPFGHAPTVAVINGHPAALTVESAGSDEVAGVATAQSESALLGFNAPSLFVAIRKAHPGENLTAWTTPDNDINVQLWTDAALRVTPFLPGWLGQRPRAQLTLLDLPDAADAPFESGALLATTLRDGAPDQLEGAMAHALTHAWMSSPRAWLSEGVAHFMGTLWIERQHGRDKALAALALGRDALSIAEPPSPGEGSGQPLALATAPIYYRTKAAYVFWMLRDIVGDATLSAALRAYDPLQDTGPPTTPSLFERLLEQAGARRDLKWFFADWVDADKGLPDLAVDRVFPSSSGAGNWLVAVNVSNSGYASAEVPITVRTNDTSITQRVRIPGRGSVVQRIVIQGRPTEVQVNDGTVPETEAAVHVTHVQEAAAPAQ